MSKYIVKTCKIVEQDVKQRRDMVWSYERDMVERMGPLGGILLLKQLKTLSSNSGQVEIIHLGIAAQLPIINFIGMK